MYAARNHMLKNSVQYLAIPKIGCGLDGLVWEKVLDIITETFIYDPVEILVYKYVPL